MKLAFSSTEQNMSGQIEPSFGRAKNFIVFDLQTRTFEPISNTQNLNAAQGAGIQAAQTIIRSGARAFVTRHCGPKAFRVLEAAGIKVFNTDTPTIAEALALYEAGQLSEAVSANVEGHWV